MSVVELVSVSGVILNLIVMFGGLIKLTGFFTRLENRLTRLEVLYDTIEKRKTLN